jgi:hypothetical protein
MKADGFFLALVRKTLEFLLIRNISAYKCLADLQPGEAVLIEDS